MKKIKKRVKAKNLTNNPNNGKIYAAKMPMTGFNFAPNTYDEEPFNTRSSRNDEDDNGLVSGIATILAAEIVEDIVETVFDSPNTDTQQDTQDFGGFGDGDSGGGGAVDSY